jgi:hypothetical protein
MAAASSITPNSWCRRISSCRVILALTAMSGDLLDVRQDLCSLYLLTYVKGNEPRGQKREGEALQLRLTTWPPGAIPVPCVRPAKVWRIDGPWIEFDSIQDAEPRELPPEVYLRDLWELDVHSTDDLAAFCEEYGRLGLPDFSELGWAADPGQLGVRSRSSDRGEAAEAFDLVGARIREIRNSTTRYPTLGDREFTHTKELALHAIKLRDCTRIWRYYAGTVAPDGTQVHDFDLDALNAEWEGRRIPGVPPIQNLEDGLNYLADALYWALGTFRPYLTFDGVEQWQGIGKPEWAPTYGALWTQFFNHLAEHTPYHICANEACANKRGERVMFVQKQSGKGQKGQVRTGGVKYCSRSCENAQAQREYRRRKRTQKLASEQHDKTGE